MRTESLRRVYCDACGKMEEMWMPYEPENIVTMLTWAGWRAETWRESDRTHMHLTTPLIIGRVVCPDCAKGGDTKWTC